MYDVVIIGSGFGGLACGAILSKSGLKVCILEKSNQPGGCVQSYKRGNLYFDTGLHYVGGLGEGQSMHDAFDRLGLMDLPWKRMDKDFDHIIIGNRRFHLAQGYDNFIESLSKDFPNCHDRLVLYADKLQHTSTEDMDISAWQWLKDTLQDDLLIDVVSGSTMKIELRKDSLPLFSFLHSNKSYIESSWRLQGDGNMIVERLISTIRENGGEIRCNAAVTDLIQDETGITSARCSDGQVFPAGYFIADIHPVLLCSMLNMEVRKNRLYAKRMQACENTYGVFTTSLTLKPEALRYANHNAYIYDKKVWRDEGNTDCVMVSQRQPESGSDFARQVDLLTPMTWEECKPWENTRVGHRGESYRRMCEERAQASIRLAERFIPSLGDMVERKFTSSPLTYRDYLSSPEGNAFGMRKDYRKSMLTFHSVKTPVKNLFLTGQNVILSGIEGVTMTAFDTCRQIK